MRIIKITMLLIMTIRWKMIPSVLKCRVISDDSQFVLSIGVFARLSEEVRCEIYVLPPEDGNIFTV